MFCDLDGGLALAFCSPFIDGSAGVLSAVRMSCHQPFSVRLRPQCHPRWRALPIFGPVLDNFVQWLHEERGYTLATTSAYLNGVREVVRCLQSRRIGDLAELTLQDLRAAHRRFLGRDPAARDAARALEQFLRAQSIREERR